MRLEAAVRDPGTIGAISASGRSRVCRMTDRSSASLRAELPTGGGERCAPRGLREQGHKWR
jgi:hypothetical protein